MKTTFISLKPLYDFIWKHKKEYEEGLNLRKPLGEDYSSLCDERIIDVIPETQGIYLWGCYDKKKYWGSLYLGKAGLGKAKKLLRARISEELKGERCCLWRAVCSEETLYEIGPKVHRNPQLWDPGIKRIWRRALRKAGATHIVWAPCHRLNNKDIEAVEADLIEALNPTANIRRPLPPKHLRRETARIFKHLRQNIHDARGTRFTLTLE